MIQTLKRLFLNLDERQIRIYIVSMTAVLLSLAVMGGILAYSPVPFWDMWGTIHFFDHYQDEGWAAWWRQHNEHRIVISRMFFWLDFTLFNGSSVFLIIVNYLLAGMAYLIFNSILKDVLPDARDKLTRFVASMVILCMMFYWWQTENLMWTFQSQFFMAQSLPLLALYLLYKSHASNSSIGHFLMACLVGVLCVGTMANGILALPIMFVFAVLIRMRWEYSLLLLILAVGEMTLYFQGYSSISDNGSLRDALLDTPFEYVQYVLVYLGNPLYSFSRFKIIAGMGGLFLLGSAAMFFLRSMRAPAASSLQLMLVMYLAYIIGTAVGTGGGRLLFGLHQALSSRYATPTLMAWATLLLLYIPFIAEKARINVRVLWPVLLIPALMMPYQLKALFPKKTILFERMMGALALEMRVEDQSTLIFIFPDSKSVMKLSLPAVENDWTVFNEAPIKGAAQLIGTHEEQKALEPCEGTLIALENITNESRFIRAKGTLIDAASQKVPALMHILDKDRTVIGYALTGGKDPHGERTGFKGYVLSERQGDEMILKGINPDCEVTVKLPRVSKDPEVKHE